MSLSWAILLASIIVSLTLLYINTRDTWNWRMLRIIFKWLAISLISLIILITIYFVLYNYIDNMPRKLTELEGIKLGQTRQEVIDSLGSPFEDNYDKWHSLTYKPDGDYGDEIYAHFYSNKDEVYEVQINPKYNYKIKKDIINKYGKPNNIIKGELTAERWRPADRWEYPQYNMYFEFFQDDNKLVDYGIYSPKPNSFVPDKTTNQ